MHIVKARGETIYVERQEPGGRAKAPWIIKIPTDHIYITCVFVCAPCVYYAFLYAPWTVDDFN